MRRTTVALAIALAIFGASAARADSASYTYDSQRRLASATYTNAAGNRTSIVTN